MGSGAVAGGGMAGALSTLASAWRSWPAGPERRAPHRGRLRRRCSANSQQDECLASGPVPTLTAAQATNAETIVAAARRCGCGQLRSADRVDGGLHRIVIGEPRVPSRATMARSGCSNSERRRVGGRRPRSRIRPMPRACSSSDCLAVPHWQTIAPWVAAQDVQNSAFSGVASEANEGSSVVGGNYEANWDLGRKLLRAITALSDDEDCGGENGAEPAGPASSFGLPAGYRHPVQTPRRPRPSSSLTPSPSWVTPMCGGRPGRIASTVQGLTMMAWAQAGVALEHYTGDQINEGTPVAGYGAISPGDLVLIPGSEGTLANPGHVGIYIGYGLVLSATDPEQGVIVQTWANFTCRWPLWDQALG